CGRRARAPLLGRAKGRTPGGRAMIRPQDRFPSFRSGPSPAGGRGLEPRAFVQTPKDAPGATLISHTWHIAQTINERLALTFSRRARGVFPASSTVPRPDSVQRTTDPVRRLPNPEMFHES